MTKCLRCGNRTLNKSNKYCEECLLDIESIRGLDDQEDE